ncbi:hypothetical protein [Haloplanus sp. C73]|uniref:hypothetical protein n=1 Tax=Haloplanus sp. C73 TaxID=3421641 RepID=UPI003EBDF437
MTRDLDLPTFSRRRVLQTIGTASASGLAGCASSGTGTDESTETFDSPEPTAEPTETSERREVQDIPVEEFVAIWFTEVNPEDNAFAGSFSPQQLRTEISETLTEGSYGKVAYEDLPYAPGDVPQTFIRDMNIPVHSSIKVDQLPATTPSEQVTSTLAENDYEQVQDVEGYSIYRNPSADAVYGVGSGRVVIGVNYNEPARYARNSQHQKDVVARIEERSQTDSGFTTSMEDAIAALEIHDSLGIWEYDSDDADLVDGLDPEYQPDVGMTSVDIDADIQYGSWAFEDENLAEWVHADLQEGGSPYEWERITQSDNVITAAGEARVKYHINEPTSLNLSFPKI